MSLAPFAAIEQRIAAATLACLANAEITPPVGAAFGAEFSLAEVDPLGAPSIAADAQIVYLDGAGILSPGDTVLVNGTPWRVAADPMRQDDGTLVATLREIG